MLRLARFSLVAVWVLLLPAIGYIAVKTSVPNWVALVLATIVVLFGKQAVRHIDRELIRRMRSRTSHPDDTEDR